MHDHHHHRHIIDVPLSFEDFCNTQYNLTVWQQNVIQELGRSLFDNRNGNITLREGNRWLIITPQYYGKTTLIQLITTSLFTMIPNVKMCIVSETRRKTSLFRHNICAMFACVEMKKTLDSGSIVCSNKTIHQWNNSEQNDKRTIYYKNMCTRAVEKGVSPCDVYIVDDIEKYDGFLEELSTWKTSNPLVICFGCLKDENNMLTLLMDLNNDDGSHFFNIFTIDHRGDQRKHNKSCHPYV